MRCIALFVVALVWGVLPSVGQNSSSDFDAMVDSFGQLFDEVGTNGLVATSTLEAEYDALQEAIESEYFTFKSEVCSVWGEKSATVSDRYRWVEYGDDLSSRTIVDFESGEVAIELVLSDEEMNDAALVEAKLNSAIEQLVASRGSSIEYESKYIPRQELSPTPIMDDIFDMRSGGIKRETKVVSSPTASTKSPSLDDLEKEVAALRAESALLSPKDEVAPQDAPEEAPVESAQMGVMW